MPADPLVMVVILNWNNAPDTIECLTSVAGFDYPNFRTIVIDNGSTDDSVAVLRGAHPQVEIIETGVNLGYAEGNNVGIRHALRGDAAFVLLLNNDTLVAPTLLSRLVSATGIDARIGMAGPTIYFAHPPGQLFAAGSDVNWARGTAEHRRILEMAGPGTERKAPEAVDFIAGCGVLVRRAVIEKCGALEPKYFLNLEDVEWAIRARRHGFQVLYVPSAVMWHKGSATLGQGSPANTYYMTRNGLLFFWENSPRALRWLAVSRIVIRTLRSCTAWTVKSQYRKEDFRRRRAANLLALRDFFTGRYGAMGPDVWRACYGSRG